MGLVSVRPLRLPPLLVAVLRLMAIEPSRSSLPGRPLDPKAEPFVLLKAETTRLKDSSAKLLRFFATSLRDEIAQPLRQHRRRRAVTPRATAAGRRKQARESTLEFAACDKRYGEIYGSGRIRATRGRGVASNVRATQRDADGSSTHEELGGSANIKDLRWQRCRRLRRGVPQRHWCTSSFRLR